MDGWSQIQQVTLPSVHGQLTPAITVHAFDDQQDLLWVGDESGRITSLAGVDLRRYTSYRGHPPNDGPVKQLLFHDRGVISVGPKSVHLSGRTGLAQWHIAEKDMTDLRCMSFIGKGSEHLLVAGCQNVIFKIDVSKGRVLVRIPTTEEYTAVKTVGGYLCAASSRGTIDLLDLAMLQVNATLNTGAASINDMDGSDKYLVTCCWVNHAQGTPKLNIVANVYDVSRKAQLSPIAAQSGAAFVQLHPRMSTTCIICSQHGSLQTVDLTNPAVSLSQNHTPIQSHVTGLVLAPSGEAMALVDNGQYIQLMAPSLQVRFAKHTCPPVEWASSYQAADPVDVDADIPLNWIGMPYYRDRLLSAWSSDAIYEVGGPTAPIDPEVEEKAQPHGVGMWAPNPKKVRRNQRARPMTTNSTEKAAIAAPKFLSDQAKDAESGRNEYLKTLEDALKETVLQSATSSEVPTIYRNVEIKYSRFGVEDFDFRFYNSTIYSGLETHIANSYNNPLLQLLRFTPLVRNFALHHAAADCRQDICLLCELGFLIDTLEKADGYSCQANNLLRAFSSMDDAKAKRVLEEYSHGNSLSEMLQTSCGLFLEHITQEFKAIQGHGDNFENALALDVSTNQRCVNCNSKHDTHSKETHSVLHYQNPNQNPRYRQLPTFSQILKNSVQPSFTQSRGFCPTCRRYNQVIVKQRTIRGVPDVLVLNAAPKSKEAIQYWSKPGWLPERIGITLDGGKFTCFEGEDLRLHLQKGAYKLKVYDLVGVAADITSKQNQKSHLVSLINVAISQTRPTAESDWHLFNDFLVKQIPTEEALRFFQSWKMPSVLVFQAATSRHGVSDSWREDLDASLLYDNIPSNPRVPDLCETLDPSLEASFAGSYVAIDTEFVTLRKPEIDMKSDGERETIRPAVDGVGRVSVVRAEGDKEGMTFIDDYIRISEPIVDYQTRFSGLEPGDLEPTSTPYILKPLKIVYKKIWLLSNLGCIFIGHGLTKDFRAINIHVPPAQVIDTSKLFYTKERRQYLGLAYLAGELLGENVQEGNHDSIEDARTALHLWRKYEELRKAGRLASALEMVYDKKKVEAFRSAKRARDDAAGLLGARGGEGGGLEGRLTPDIMGRSGPGTPLRRPHGSEYFESPLR